MVTGLADISGKLKELITITDRAREDITGEIHSLGMDMVKMRGDIGMKGSKWQN